MSTTNGSEPEVATEASTKKPTSKPRMRGAKRGGRTAKTASAEKNGGDATPDVVAAEPKESQPKSNGTHPQAQKAQKGQKSSKGPAHQNRHPARRSGGGQERRARTYPTITERVQLDHDIVKGAWENHFDRFRSAFFHVTSILGRFALEDEANKVHGYVLTLIDEAEAEIKSATAALARQIETRRGIGEVPKTSNNPQTKQADIPAYVVRRYLELFQAADRLIDAIVYAETNGCISWQRRGEMLRDVPRYLRTPAGRFHSIASRLGARQRVSEGNVADAKLEMCKTVQSLLETQMGLKSIQEKRPLNSPAGAGE